MNVARGMFFGLLAALFTWAILAGAAATTLFVLNTLFLAEPLSYSFRNLIAALVLNLILGWIGAGPWFVIGLSRGNNPSV